MTTISEEALTVINRCIMEDEGGWVFTDRADDSGGPTYGGMTWKTFDAWQQHQQFGEHTREQFCQYAVLHTTGVQRNLQQAILQAYYDTFYVPGHVAEVPEFAQYMYLSALVNFGDFKEVLKWLQMAHNMILSKEYKDRALLVDGHWGPKTEAALKAVENEASNDFIDHLYDRRGIGDSFKLAFSDACMERFIRIVQRDARAWRVYANDCAEGVIPAEIPRVLQSENLMGWFNRARSYRNK